MSNPYQSPAFEQPENRRWWAAQPHILPFWVALVSGFLLAAILSGDFVEHWKAGAAAVLGVVLVFDVPVCIVVLITWSATGHPPSLNLEPLIPCAERRALYRAWRGRPQLDDEGFYDTFYAHTGISRQLVAGCRRELERMLGRKLAGLHPQDDIALAEPELDFADLFDCLSEALAIEKPSPQEQRICDGTFDSLVRMVASTSNRPAATDLRNSPGS